MSEPLAEVTLRKYERPVRLDGRELARKFALSVGLLQPFDSRDVLVDVLVAFTQAKSPLSQAQVELQAKELRSKAGLSASGCASSNIRRQIRRLKEANLVHKHEGGYALHDARAFGEHFEKVYVPQIVERVKEYCVALENMRCPDASNNK